MPRVNGFSSKSHHPKKQRRKGNTSEHRGECREGCAFPALRGLPAFVFIGCPGVRFVPRCFVGLSCLDQWNNSEVLDGEECEPCKSARRKHRHHQFSELIHLSLSDKGIRSRGGCREQRCALA